MALLLLRCSGAPIGLFPPIAALRGGLWGASSVCGGRFSTSTAHDAATPDHTAKAAAQGSGIPRFLPRDTTIEHTMIRVANLPRSITDIDEVSALFTSSGTVLSANWLRRKIEIGGEPKVVNSFGTAFLAMPPSDAEAAIRQLHASVVLGSTIAVSKYEKGVRQERAASE